MRRGASKASSGLTSGTTSGTSSSMRNALELSIMTAPWRVIVSAYSRETPAPAETNAISTPLKSDSCDSSSTSISQPRNVYLCPALRHEPNSRRRSIAISRLCNIFKNSCPTAPLAPTIAIVITHSLYISKSSEKLLLLEVERRGRVGAVVGDIHRTVVIGHLVRRCKAVAAMHAQRAVGKDPRQELARHGQRH